MREKAKMLKPVKDVQRGELIVDQGVVEFVAPLLEENPPRYVVRFQHGYDISWLAKDAAGLDVLVDVDTVLPNLIPGVG